MVQRLSNEERSELQALEEQLRGLLAQADGMESELMNVARIKEKLEV